MTDHPISGAAGHPSQHDDAPLERAARIVRTALSRKAGADTIRDLLPPGWEIDSELYGIDCLLICPCGVTIEQDGQCPDGHVSPLRVAGLI